MCVIAVQPRGKTISEQTFKNCFENNPDGCGFMYAKNGKVYGRKGIMTFKEFIKEQKKIPKDVDVIYHFRISTHGGVNPQLTHPFPLSGSFEKLHATSWTASYGVAHNGIFSSVTAPEGESDTEVFITNILKPLQELSTLKQNLIIDKFYDDIIGSAVGSSRLAILYKNGHYMLYGYGWVNGTDGCYYSNSSYSYPKYTPQNNNTKYYGNSNTANKTDYDYEYEYVSVNPCELDEILPLNGNKPPFKQEDEGLVFTDAKNNLYFFSEYSGGWIRSGYKTNHKFDESESFDIAVKRIKPAYYKKDNYDEIDDIREY